MIAGSMDSDFAAKRAATARAWFAEKQAVSQDVYALFPKEFEAGPENPERRAAGAQSFLKFCELYLPLAFRLAWSPNHRKAAERIESAVRDGAMFAFAMPRGSGKTTLARAAVLWAVAYGYSPYVVLIGATMSAAERQLRNIKTELRFNDMLFADFRELCGPVRHLNGESRKASGQKFKGVPTLIEWKKNQIVLASLEYEHALCSGAIIDVTGIEGEIRGRQLTRGDGSVARPTLAIVDDPQTRESARSAAQSQQREDVLAGDVKYMAGPDQPLGIVMPCTVICQNDMADRLLDRKRHPEYHGEKTRMLDAFPKNVAEWATYAEIRDEAFQSDAPGYPATEFYEANRAKMDEGAIATWPERFFSDHGEVSAVQHAMNLKLLDEAAFMAEYQNEPVSQQDEAGMLTPDQICSKIHGLARSIVPLDAQLLTAFIDVQKEVLYYAVCAWCDPFTGWVVEYGTYPKQLRSYFTAANLNPTLTQAFPKADAEGRIIQGLDLLTKDICGRGLKRDGGGEMRLSLAMIDEGYKQEAVHRFIRSSPHIGILKPSKGYSDRANYRIPFLQVKRQPGDRVGRGFPWRERPVANNRSIRFVTYDTNWWKTFVHDRLHIPVGSGGSLSLYGQKPQEHRLLADHLCAEYRSRINNESTGRTVEEWTLKPDRPDNHWLDALVGCAVGASLLGVTTATAPKTSQQGSPPPTARQLAERSRRAS